MIASTADDPTDSDAPAIEKPMQAALRGPYTEAIRVRLLCLAADVFPGVRLANLKLYWTGVAGTDNHELHAALMIPGCNRMAVNSGAWSVELCYRTQGGDRVKAANVIARLIFAKMLEPDE